jgi:hypothetical protein
MLIYTKPNVILLVLMLALIQILLQVVDHLLQPVKELVI